MIISYEYFHAKLNEKIKSDDEFYYDLLVKVVQNPHRYTGCFRLSNAKTKLMQNVTQSREIKFGDFMEDIITEYIGYMGYKNLEKNIGCDPDGNALSADQVFLNEKTGELYLIEQKIRDDHDSTKKRGQYDNFRKKYELLRRKNPGRKIIAIMWFIDETLVKNRRYYTGQASSENIENVDIFILYGSTLFTEIFKNEAVWNELVGHLARVKAEQNSEMLYVPDFDSSNEILQALRRLKREEPRLFNKLYSEKPEYVQLRKELFPKNVNLRKVRE